MAARRNDWAIIEVVAHMADTDERALGRVHRMVNEEAPYLPAFDHEVLARERRYIEMDLDEEVRRYQEARGAHVAALEPLDTSGWERRGRHEVHSEMTIELYESHVASEDVDHLAQIARLIPEKAAAADQRTVRA